MKNLSKALVTVIAFFGICSVANAVPFYDKVDFSGSGTRDGEDFLRVTEVYKYEQTIFFDPLAASIDNATLRIKHIGNNIGAADNELWLIRGKEAGAGDVWSKIGDLSNSTNATGWIIDTFVLGSYLFDESGAGSWTLKIKAREPGRDRERLRLGWSELSGNYTAVSASAPATLVLLATGLIGLGFIRRRRT
ncbi:MAG TPA: PEP-CTERM sorting domain-containing protein [Chromatiales bacterium]|nr:PEP-CTERM sorting domain-containing protein [Chromatiales bacterium]